MGNPKPSPYGPSGGQHSTFPQFYGSSQQQQQQQPQGPPFPPRGPPGMYGGPPPPPPRGAMGPFPGGAPRPMPPPPRPGMPAYGPGALPRGAPSGSAAPWQWSTGRQVETVSSTTTVISAAPVRFNVPARGPNNQHARPAAPASAFQGANVPPAAAKGGAATDHNTKWPDALHDYVKRAFARCKGPADQQLTQNQLKTMITDAITNNLLWTKNWAAEPLPRLVGDAPTVRPNVVNGPPMPPPPRPFAPPVQQFRAPPMPHSASFIPFNNPTKGQGQKRKSDAAGHLNMSQEDLKKKNQRRQRFLREQSEMGHSVTPTVDTSKLRVLTSDGELDLEAMTIKGTSQVVEKEYLRLTSAPHPSTVRPEPVLHQALEMVKSKWKQGSCDYVYACSQLKSIRQDCTVQRIKNEFTVRVYETHARVALESGDINEFNQCQTQLHELYEKSIPGKAIEFLSYRILYCIYVTLQAKKIDSNAGQLGMYSVLANVTRALRQEDCIRHALDVREAVAANNYHRFFQLYMDAPNMAGYLMDSMVPTIRLRALRAMCKAYRPNVPIDFIRNELRLEGKEGDEFIAKSGLAFVSGSKGELVDTKNSDVVRVLSDQSSLI